MNSDWATSRIIVTVLLGLSAAAVLSGCDTTPRAEGPAPRPVDLAAFAQPSDGAGRAAPTPSNGVDQASAGAVVDTGVRDGVPTDRPPASGIELRAASGDFDAEPQHSNEAVAEAAIQPGERLIVDSLVGQVNGRPIFADEFFTPIEDQLLAVAEQSTLREFESRAREIIAVRLRDLVTSELIITEAQSQLTVEQRQGLFHVLRMLREEAIAERGGTQAGTVQRLQEEEGISLEEYVATQRDEQLIRSLYFEKILPRATYSWRDVELEYRRRYDEFNPPGRVRILRLRVPTDDAKRVEEAKTRLAAADPFAEVAESFGETDGGAWQSFQLSSAGVDDLPLSDSVKERLSGLQPGQTSEPFEVGNSTWWLHIAEIMRPPGRALHEPEVQRSLNELVRRRRISEEEDRFVQSLLERGVYDELSAMNEILVHIAVLRYGPG